MERFHVPVLLNQVLRFLLTEANGTIFDCTVGDGGHSLAILEATSPRGKLVGIDRDPEAISRAGRRLLDFGNRVVLVQQEFARIEEVFSNVGSPRVSGFLFDLGVSWHQIDDPARGFSYQKDGPLDMRMNREDGRAAWNLVNELEQEELCRILRDYGEERRARPIANLICKRREQGGIRTTGELSLLVRKMVPRRRALKVLSRVFQALRIAVNDELSQLRKGLAKAVELLPRGGRVAVIAYHSLEDRIVKQTFQSLETQGVVKTLTKKVVKPSKAEVKENPKARSARLRVAEKI